MSWWRGFVALLATLAVVGVGWIGWEEHRQTGQQVEQACLSRAAAKNAILSDEFTEIGANSAVTDRGPC